MNTIYAYNKNMESLCMCKWNFHEYVGAKSHTTLHIATIQNLNKRNYYHVTKQIALIIELTILLQSKNESRFNNHYANSTNKHLNIQSISHSNCHALISAT